MLGPIISAGSNLIGGLLGKSSADKAAAQNMAIAQQNFAMQKEFAQKGIRWKVEDAKQAGIHPAFALGASTSSFTPVSFSASADDSMSKAVSSMGSDIGRAIHTTRTDAEKEDAYTTALKTLQVQRGQLENQLLASQIAKTRTQIGPSMPAIEADAPTPFPVPEGTKSEDRPPLMASGFRWMTNPNTSPMKAWEDQYGDDGPVSWTMPLLILANDAQYNARRAIRYFANKGRAFVNRPSPGGSGW